LPSAKTAEWLRRHVAGVHIPDDAIRRLAGATNQRAEGRQLCIELIQQIREIKGVSGVHVMAYRQEEAVAEVIDASGVIENAGFTIIDDLLHGYGGGYLPPILGSKSRPAGPVPDAPFRAGQTVVIQPNVVTRDGKAGVQTGEMVLITDTGIERMHAMPRGFQII
jgi:hypothetical protein